MDWRRGHDEDGRARLEEAERHAADLPIGFTGTLRGWLGTYFLEHRQPASAADYFGVNESRSLVALYMGRAYEATGERENARRAYEWLTIAWRDA